MARRLTPEIGLRVTLGVLVLLALVYFTDFGITWDEAVEHHLRRKGPRTFAWWFGGFDAENAMFDTGHNPLTWFLYYTAFRGLDAIGIAPPIVDSYHAFTALISVVGVLFAYRVAKHVLPGWWPLVAAVLVALTPRYLGHSFGNFKDIPFAVAWLAALDTLLRAVKTPTPRTICWHGVALGALLVVRVGGLMFLPVSGVGLLIAARRAAPGWRPLLAWSTAALVLAVALHYLSYPYVLMHPIRGMAELIATQADFDWAGNTLTLGALLEPKALPWWYAPLWLGITLPEVVLAGLATGTAIGLTRRRLPEPALALILVATLLPLAYVVVARSPLYDGPRHLLFLMPLAAILATRGWHAVHTRLPTRWAVPGVLALAGIVLAVQIVRLHPYQTVWFNQLVGGLPGAEGEFTLEYWGSSSLETSEWLKENATEPASLCVLAEVAYSWEVYLPDWTIEGRPDLPRCPVGAHYAVVFRRNRWHAGALAYAERHPHLWRVVHQIEREGVVLATVLQNPRPAHR